MLSFKAKAS